MYDSRPGTALGKAPIDPIHGFPEHFPPGTHCNRSRGKSALESHETGLWGLPRAFPGRLSYILLFCHYRLDVPLNIRKNDPLIFHHIIEDRLLEKIRQDSNELGPIKFQYTPVVDVEKVTEQGRKRHMLSRADGANVVYRGAKILRSTKDFSYFFGVGENGAGWVCPGGLAASRGGNCIFFFCCGASL